MPVITEEFLANGTYTVPHGAAYALMECWAGGGGGGGNGGGGGGGGGYARKVVSGLIANDAWAVVVGAGGQGAGAGLGNGSTGNPSRVRDPLSVIVVQATGGGGGQTASSGGTGGASGTFNVGDAGFNGGAGGNGTLTDIPGFPDALAYYKFDGNADDSSGNGFHASVNVGTPTYTAAKWGDGVFSNEGVDTEVEFNVASIGTIASGQPWSWAAWVKGQAGAGPISFDINWGNYQFAVTDSLLYNLFKAGGGGGTLAAGSYAGNSSWRHWAITHSGTTIKLYLDGVEIESVADSGEVSGQLLMQADTKIDDATILDDLVFVAEEFTPAEITSLVNGTFGYQTFSPGGGGEGASSVANGNTGSTGGAGGAGGTGGTGGDGGAGGSPGTVGSVPGGGGGGGAYGQVRGNGASGRVLITTTIPNRVDFTGTVVRRREFSEV